MGRARTHLPSAAPRWTWAALDRSARRGFECGLWILGTSAPWGDPPRRYPPYRICHRRFQLWAAARASRPLAPTIGDRGYDSDALDDTLMTTYGIEMIAARRRGRARTQDGRSLRRASRRRKVERYFAWLHTRFASSRAGNAASTTASGWRSSPVPASCFWPQSNSLPRCDGSTVGAWSR